MFDEMNAPGGILIIQPVTRRTLCSGPDQALLLVIAERVVADAGQASQLADREHAVSPGTVLSPGVYSKVKPVVSHLSRLRGRNLHDWLTDAADRIEEEPWGSPKRIEEDRCDADCHRHHCPDRVDQASGRNRNADPIEKERKRHVLHHLAVAATADLACNCQHIQSIRQD